MLEIPIKFKEIKYPKRIGKTTGGIYTNAVLKIDEDILRFEHSNLKIFKYLFNQLPIEFKKNVNEPEKFYLNEHNEYKIRYSTKFKNCEITFKTKREYSERLNLLIENWNV